MASIRRLHGRGLRSSYIVLGAMTAALVPLAVAHAQTAASATTQASPLSLDKIVVTGTARKVTKMKSSVSVSTLGAQAIAVSGASSAADVIRNIPGVQSQASGGESNANVTVRGLPISAGGSRYVQFQENGLPVLDFGDIAFATPDSFIRIDGMLDQVQVVRGGSASTLATNAPGGIINFIDKTGKTQGGSVSATSGLGYNEQRLDFDYGGPIDANNRYEIAGFYNTGNGTRNAGTTIVNGGQIHGNFTHDIEGGFVRLNFKYLNDITPTDLPVPVSIVNNTITALPGIDPRTASFYSKYFGTDTTLTGANGLRSTNIGTGNYAETKSVGGEFNKTFDNGINIDDNFRYSDNTGNFLGLYPSDNGVTLTGATYGTGPNAGQAYNGAAFGLITFDTKLNDLSNIANDLKISAPPLDEGSFGTFTPTVGFYVAQQKVNLTWDFNQYYATLSGNNPQFLNAVNGPYGPTGANLQAGGLGSGFGHCCERVINGSYLTMSPYFDLGWSIGNFTSDASVREDIQQASGSYSFASANGNPAPNNNAVYQNGSSPINYTVKHTSYSIGTNYQFNRDLAVFARVSDGSSFNADRVINGPGAQQLNGSVPVPINTVMQYEGGVKARYGNFNAFVTLFDAQTAESNYSATTQVSSANKYDAYGTEIELGYVYGGFRVTGGATYTHSRITATTETYGTGGSVKGNVPQRQADWIFQVAPSYTYGAITVGGSAIGTTSSFANDQNNIVMPGYVLFNAFVNYQITPHLALLFTGNNILNTLAYTEYDGTSNGLPGAPASGTSARAFDGQTFKGTLKYTF